MHDPLNPNQAQHHHNQHLQRHQHSRRKLLDDGVVVGDDPSWHRGAWSQDHTGSRWDPSAPWDASHLRWCCTRQLRREFSPCLFLSAFKKRLSSHELNCFWFIIEELSASTAEFSSSRLSLRLLPRRRWEASWLKLLGSDLIRVIPYDTMNRNYRVTAEPAVITCQKPQPGS